MKRRWNEAEAAQAARSAESHRAPSTAAAASQDEEDALGTAHRLLGNDAWAASLSTGHGPGSVLATQWVLNTAGVQAGGDVLGGNQAMLSIMRKATPLTPQQLNAAHIIETATGSPLPDSVRTRMERAFGRDLGHVRIHTDSRAAQAAQGMSAHAFTVGSNIYFGPNEYQPGTLKGDRLLLHELTHVVQSDENRLPSGGGVSQPTDRAEVEAYRNEDRLYGRLDDTTLGDAAAPTLGEGAPQGREAGEQASAAVSYASLAAAPVLRQDDEEATGDSAQNPDIPVDEVVARTIQPLQQSEEVATAIRAEKQLRQEQGIEDNLPDTLPEDLVSTQPEVEGQGSEAIGLQLQSPTELAPAAIEGLQITPGQVSSAVAIEVPQVQEAWGRYSAAATIVLGSIATAGTDLNTAIADAITSASQEIVTRAQRLKTQLSERIVTASGNIDTYKGEAHAALLVKFNERKAALTTEKDAVLATLDTSVQGYRNAITDKTTELSAALEQLGRDHSAAVAQEARSLSEEAVAIGEAQRAHWANEASWNAIDNDYSQDLAADVGLYAVNTARAAAQKIVNAAADVIDDFREDGTELAEDLRENGTEYAEEFDSKVEDVREWYNDDLPNAEQRLQTEYDNAKGQIDTTAEDLKRDLSQLEEDLGTQLDQGVNSVSGQLELAGLAAQEAVRLALADTTTVIQEQVAEIEAWLSEADPSHWPALVEVLDELAGELQTEAPAVIVQIQQIGDALLTAIAQGGIDGVAAIDTLWTKVDSQVATFESNARNTLVTDVVAKIDEEVLQTKVSNEREGWDEQRGRHETELSEASTELAGELQKEHDQGKTNLDEKKTETLSEMASPLDTLREELIGDCRYMAEHPWRARLAQFGKGLLGAIVSFLKVLAVIVLVVVVVAALIAAVLGFKVLLAIAGVIAGFVATYSAIIGTIAAILTVISLVLAAIPMIADWIGYFNGTTSSFEASNSSGGFVGTALTEFLPDMGIAALTSSGKVVNAVDAPSDIAQGVRSLNALDDTVPAITNLSEDVATATGSAGKVDEFAELVTSGEKAGDALDELAVTANVVEESIDTAGDGARVVEETVDAAKATEDVADTTTDAANGAEELSGTLRSDAPQYANGMRFDPVSRRWVKPETPDQWAAYIQARNSGYGGRFTKFRTASSGGKAFDPVSRRWVKPDAPDQWAAYIQARNNGYGGRFTEFRTASRGGKTFDPTSGDMVTPPPAVVDAAGDGARVVEETVDAAEDSAKVVEETADLTEDVADGVGDGVNALEETSAGASDGANPSSSSGDGTFSDLRYTPYGMEGPLGLIPGKGGFVGAGGELMGNWAAVQAAYDTMKGVATSLWLVLNNGAPINEVGGLATYVTERDATLSELEEASGE